MYYSSQKRILVMPLPTRDVKDLKRKNCWFFAIFLFRWKFLISEINWLLNKYILFELEIYLDDPIGCKNNLYNTIHTKYLLINNYNKLQLLLYNTLISKKGHIRYQCISYSYIRIQKIVSSHSFCFLFTSLVFPYQL